MVLARFSVGSFLLLGLATACSSSSSNGTPDGGPAGDGSTVLSPVAEAGGAGLGIMATCGALSALGGGASGSCPSGQTCCTMILPPSASCVPTGGCAGGISTECSKGSDCASGQVCCAGAADGGVMAAADASTAGGIGGLLGNFDPSTLSTTCQTSCTSTQMQYCSVDTDCPTGLTCQTPGGAGALGGIIMLPSVCAAPRPDAGTDAGTVPDSGAEMGDDGATDAAGD